MIHLCDVVLYHFGVQLGPREETVAAHFEEHADVGGLGEAEGEQMRNHEHLYEQEDHASTQIGGIHDRLLVLAHGLLGFVLLSLSFLRSF